jgi:hypothetical protein
MIQANHCPSPRPCIPTLFVFPTLETIHADLLHFGSSDLNWTFHAGPLPSGSSNLDLLTHAGLLHFGSFDLGILTNDGLLHFGSSDLGINFPTSVSYTLVVPTSGSHIGLLQSIIDIGHRGN